MSLVDGCGQGNSRFWGPAAALDDSYEATAYFADFPYADKREGSLVFGRMRCDCGAHADVSRVKAEHAPWCLWHSKGVSGQRQCDCGALADSSVERTEHAPWCAWHSGSSKRFSGRFTTEWAEQPGDLSRIGGRLQLNTTPRFGLDAQMDWLREPSTGPLEDELWLGDCNVVFRFAQSERAQFYSGVGFNWLDDPIDTDFGFNFTYGADLFPVKPWVVSSSIDWGSLGRAELFRFRTTAGLMINRVEVFAGYEYLDIDRTQVNTYVAGVGIWF